MRVARSNRSIMELNASVWRAEGRLHRRTEVGVGGELSSVCDQTWLWSLQRGNVEGDANLRTDLILVRKPIAAVETRYRARGSSGGDGPADKTRRLYVMHWNDPGT